MKLITVSAIAGILLLTSPLFSAPFLVIDNCDSSFNWKLECLGASGSSMEVSDNSIEGRGSLLLSFVPERPNLEQLKISSRKRINLSRYERLEFWVKGLAPGKRFKFILTDSSGKEMVTCFNPGLLVQDITRLPWRRITIRLEKEKIDLFSIESCSVIITDEKSPRSKRKAKLWIDYIAAFSGPPPENLSFRYPEELSLKKTDRLNVLYIREPLKIVKKRWNLKSILESIDPRTEIKESTWKYIPYEYAAKLSYFPSFYSQLTKYNLVILQASELPKGEYHKMLKDYLEGGGSILVLAGYASLGKSKIEGTILSNIIPVKTEGPWDMVDGSSLSITSPPESKMLSGINLSPKLLLPFYQKTIAKPQATVELKIGEGPLLVSWQYGKGRAAVLTGTVLGKEIPSGRVPFWEWEFYPELMKEIISWLTGGEK